MTESHVRQMSCMTIATTAPDALAAFLADAMGWELVCDVAVDDLLRTAWGLAADALCDRARTFRSPGMDRGAIRVVAGADRYPSRNIGARWSGVEIVVTDDIDGLHDRIAGRPDYRPGTAPDNADFTDVGANIHRFFWGRPAGGTHIMYTAAVTPARDYDFPTAPAQVGHIFSIPLVTTDFARSFAFYTQVLGLEPVLLDKLSDGIWHKTWSLRLGEIVDLAVMKGRAPGFGLGGIELQGYDPGVVDPVPPVADRLDGGACLGTFVAVDFDAAFAAVKASGAPCGTPRAIAAAPYHGARTFAFVGPGGERVEIAEAFDLG